MIGASFLWAFIVLVIKKLSSMNPHFLVLRSIGSDEEALEPENFTEKEARSEMIFSILQGGYWVLGFLPTALAVSLSPPPFVELCLWILVLNGALFFTHLWIQRVTLEGSAALRKFLFRLHSKVRDFITIVLEWEATLHEILTVKEVFGSLVESFRNSILKSSIRVVQKEEERGLEVEEREILNQLDGLFYTGVSLVMTPVSRVISIPQTWSIKQALDHSSLHGHSRYPVLNEQQEVIGIFRANQLSLIQEEDLHLTERMDDEIRIQSEISCYEALEELKRNKRQIANVYNHQTWVGLVSIEDLLEEFVGEIEDEFDESDLRKTSEDGFIANASISIPKLQHYFSEPFKNTRSRTLNGFLLTRFGKVPPKYSSVVLETIRITILETDGSKVKKVRIQRLKPKLK